MTVEKFDVSGPERSRYVLVAWYGNNFKLYFWKPIFRSSTDKIIKIRADNPRPNFLTHRYIIKILIKPV